MKENTEKSFEDVKEQVETLNKTLDGVLKENMEAAGEKVISSKDLAEAIAKDYDEYYNLNLVSPAEAMFAFCGHMKTVGVVDVGYEVLVSEAHNLCGMNGWVPPVGNKWLNKIRFNYDNPENPKGHKTNKAVGVFDIEYDGSKLVATESNNNNKYDKSERMLENDQEYLGCYVRFHANGKKREGTVAVSNYTKEGVLQSFNIIVGERVHHYIYVETCEFKDPSTGEFITKAQYDIYIHALNNKPSAPSVEPFIGLKAKFLLDKVLHHGVIVKVLRDIPPKKDMYKTPYMFHITCNTLHHMHFEVEPSRVEIYDESLTTFVPFEDYEDCLNSRAEHAKISDEDIGIEFQKVKDTILKGFHINEKIIGQQASVVACMKEILKARDEAKELLSSIKVVHKDSHGINKECHALLLDVRFFKAEADKARDDAEARNNAIGDMLIAVRENLSEVEQKAYQIVGVHNEAEATLKEMKEIKQNVIDVGVAAFDRVKDASSEMFCGMVGIEPEDVSDINLFTDNPEGNTAALRYISEYHLYMQHQDSGLTAVAFANTHKVGEYEKSHEPKNPQVIDADEVIKQALNRTKANSIWRAPMINIHTANDIDHISLFSSNASGAEKARGFLISAGELSLDNKSATSEIVIETANKYIIIQKQIELDKQ